MYHQLTHDNRIALATLKRAGYSLRGIAREIGVHHSTIVRELHRNTRTGGRYHASSANRFAKHRRRVSNHACRLIENNAALAGRIEQRLNPLISPEVVAYEEGIAHGTIYAWIGRSRHDLLALLPQRGRKRRRYGSKRSQKQGWTQHVRPIDERTERKTNWEGDTIKGSGRSRVFTHVECASLYTVADLIPFGSADAVHEKVVNRNLSGTITYDRGSEFALWRMIERDTDAEVFFALPHHPWQRGKNENTNGRLRRIFPKRFDFSTITQRELDRVVWLMNHTPRKSLGWRTPAEVFREMRCTSD